MTATLPPAAPAEPYFDGRSFVTDDAPAGESPSLADGNDDDGKVADEDAPSEHVAGDEGENEDQPAGEGIAEAGEAKPTFWDQTPEEKRQERFDHALSRGNELAKQVKEYKAKLAKYESGDGPKPAEPVAEAPAPQTPDELVNEIFTTALKSEDVSKLSENQRSIRRLDSEVIALHKETVIPADERFQKAAETLSAAEKALKDEQVALAWIKKRGEGREGLYDTEIAEAEASVARLEGVLTRAEARHVNARLDLKEASEKYSLRLEANRNKALALAKQDGRRHQETASQAEEERWTASEKQRLGELWDKDVKAVLDALKIPVKLRKAAEAQAYRDVEALVKTRGDKNPVLETEFKKLITESIKADIGSFADSAAGQSEAEAAEVRARATDQPGPKRRVATTGGDAKPQTVEEAENELRTTLRGARVRAA